jgi:hypothetical protein
MALYIIYTIFKNIFEKNDFICQRVTGVAILDKVAKRKTHWESDS